MLLFNGKMVRTFIHITFARTNFNLVSFNFLQGKSYFFKGKGFWKFDDSIMRVAHDRPLSSAVHWMGCERTEHDVELEPTRRAPLTSAHSDARIKNVSISLTFWCCFVVLCFRWIDRF